MRLDAGWPNAVAPGGPSPWSWVIETMPVPRSQGAAVLLPNGMVLLLSGGQWGKPGGSLAGYATGRVSAASAVLYNPFDPEGQRYTCLGATTIERFYTNSALLLPSGDVLVAGGEQGALTVLGVPVGLLYVLCASNFGVNPGWPIGSRTVLHYVAAWLCRGTTCALVCRAVPRRPAADVLVRPAWQVHARVPRRALPPALRLRAVSARCQRRPACIGGPCHSCAGDHASPRLRAGYCDHLSLFG